MNFKLYSEYRRELLKICSGTTEVVNAHELVIASAVGNASTQLSNVLSIPRKQDQVWSPENVNVLIRWRSQVNPMCFEEIAQQLNTLEERNQTLQSS